MNLKSIYYRYYKPINGILFFITLGCLALANRQSVFFYDSWHYWEFAKQYRSGGYFGLWNFNDALRGYLFPLLLYPSYTFAKIFHLNEVLTCRFYLITLFSLAYTYGTVNFYKLFFKDSLLPLLHAFFGFIIIVLWWEYFTVPLSDAPGFFFLMCAFTLLQKQNRVFYFLSGACLYAALNIRLVYVLAIPFYLFQVLFLVKGNQAKVKIILIASAGFFLIAFPQFYNNRNNFNVNTILVPTQASEETEGKNLFLMQLTLGLSGQKYEGNVGKEYPVAAVKYIDKEGEELSRVHGNKDFESNSEYISFVLQHPAIFISYLKHTFNGLDITTSRAYILNDFYNRSILLKLFNYSVLFLGFLGLLLTFRKVPLQTKVITCLIICLTLAVVPVQVEVRYFMPIHFLLYFYTIHLLQNSTFKTINFKKKSLLVILLCYFCFTGVCFIGSKATMDQIEFKKGI